MLCGTIDPNKINNNSIECELWTQVKYVFTYFVHWAIILEEEKILNTHTRTEQMNILPSRWNVEKGIRQKPRNDVS